MKVGMIVPGMQSMELNEGLLQLAEALGMDSIWLPDHLLGVTHPALWSTFEASVQLADPDAWLDPFCVAAVLGRKTRLAIGTCVTDTVRRRGPDLARTLMTLNASCGGGFILGIGSGEAESLLPFGYDFTRPVGKLEEAARTIRALLDTGRLPDAEKNDMQNIGRSGLSPIGPNGRAQLWIAGGGERALEIVGRYADGWLPTGMTPEEFARKRARVSEIAAAAGRPRPICGLFTLTLLGDSREQIAAAYERQPLAKLIALFAPASLWRRYGLEHPSGPECRGHPDTIPHAVDPQKLRDLAQKIPFAMMEDYLLIGNAEDIAARLQPYAEAGAEHVILGDFTGLTFAPTEAGRLLTTQMGRLRQLLSAM